MLVELMLLVWQFQKQGGAGGGGGGGAGGAAGGILSVICWLFIIALNVVSIIGMWKAFEKAGKPGWAAIIPYYNVWVMVEIAGKPASWFFLILCVPCANIVFLILLMIEIANKFGQGAGFGIGLAFLGFIFWPILGFGAAQYEGGSRRRRVRDYDEDEDDRPRRRRPRDEEDEEEEERPRRRPARDEDDDDDEDDRRVRRRPRDDD